MCAEQAWLMHCHQVAAFSGVQYRSNGSKLVGRIVWVDEQTWWMGGLDTMLSTILRFLHVYSVC